MNSKSKVLHHICFPSPLGWILLAAGPEGICLLDVLGSAPPSETLSRELLQKAYPGSTAANPDFTAGRDLPSSLLYDSREAVLRYLQDGIPLPSFPLDTARGTPFQQKTWKALCKIPFGETRTYSELAGTVGRLQGARAVGQACGRNPIALLIPCHRVVRAGGSLGGYTGGLHIKKALLDLEQKHLGDGPRS